MKLNPKDTVENVKHLKIQHLFDNPKNTESMTSSQKNTDFPNSKPTKILCLPLLVNMPSPPPGGLILVTCGAKGSISQRQDKCYLISN